MQLLGGKIKGNITDQTDLKNALDTISDNIPTDLSQLSNTTTKFVNETQLESAISALGNVFTLKGSVPNVASLPATRKQTG